MLLAGVGALAPVATASAACVITGSPDTVDTCTGDVSGGERYATPSSAANDPPDPPTNHTLNASSLSPNITPAAGNAGLSITSTGDDGANGDQWRRWHRHDRRQ